MEIEIDVQDKNGKRKTIKTHVPDKRPKVIKQDLPKPEDILKGINK